jgi:hypothetical protein
MRKQEIEEGLGELADVAERDHEVQMARADLYKLAKYAIKLHEMLKTVSEAEGIEGWQQAKITKAADYLGSVYHSLDYDMAHDGGQLGESKKDTHCSDKCCGATLKREDCKCPPDCEHCNCNDPKVEEGKFKSDAHRKADMLVKQVAKRKKLVLERNHSKIDWHQNLLRPNQHVQNVAIQVTLHSQKRSKKALTAKYAGKATSVWAPRKKVARL